MRRVKNRHENLARLSQGLLWFLIEARIHQTQRSCPKPERLAVTRFDRCYILRYLHGENLYIFKEYYIIWLPNEFGIAVPIDPMMVFPNLLFAKTVKLWAMNTSNASDNILHHSNFIYIRYRISAFPPEISVMDFSC